jgi:glycosyltransferase involved in cell wall biosynthesis
MAPDPGRRLRVLTLDGIGTTGGAETIARRIAMTLDGDRFEAAFCSTRWEDDNPEYEAVRDEVRAAGLEFIGLRRHGRLHLRPWRDLIAYMREWEVDVLHSHMFGSNVWGALLAPRVPDAVFVAHEHTWSYEGQPHRRWLDRHLIARRADAFVAVSREDRRRMVSVEKVPEEKTRFIANGIDPVPPPDPGHDVRAELGIAPGQPIVGVVAVPRPQKALEVLLRAAVVLRRTVPDLRVLVVGGTGDPPAPPEVLLHRQAEELGLGETVRFLGIRTDVADLLAAFDVAVLSSDFEGSPLSVMEYMAAAKPVVATRVGGVPDLVEDGVTGLLVERRDPEALAGAVATLLADPERARAMGKAGRERQRREFTIAATARRVEELYDELIAKRTAT